MNTPANGFPISSSVARRSRVRKKKRRVDRNDFLRGFDQVRIDCILFSCVLMNYDIV
jgi:hypothetical protein